MLVRKPMSASSVSISAECVWLNCELSVLVHVAVLSPEEPPRWPALSEVLSEIRTEVAAAADPAEQPLWPEKVLIVAADLAACRRIREVRTHPPSLLLTSRGRRTAAGPSGPTVMMIRKQR